MGSVLRPVKKRKRSRRLGEVEVMRREEYAECELDAKVEAIRRLVPLGLMHVSELLDQEVTEGLTVRAGGKSSNRRWSR